MLPLVTFFLPMVLLKVCRTRTLKGTVNLGLAVTKLGMFKFGLLKMDSFVEAPVTLESYSVVQLNLDH